MKMCTKILTTAVLSVSLGGAAWAQSSTAGQSSTGGSTSTMDPSGTGSSTGGSATGGSSTGSGAGGASGAGATGSGATGSGATGSGATGSGSVTGDTSSDAMGSSTASQSRDMQRGAMGGGSDRQMAQQLQKISSMPDKATDALFVLEAAGANLYEVEFARIAQQKSQDQQIKDLAKMMEQDHTQANEKLRPVAQKMGLELPQSLPSHKQQMLQVKQALSAEDFDTCYLLDNKASHAKSITSFADHQKAAKDDQLKQYISQTLPKLKQHGQHVQQLASSKGFSTPLGGGGSSDAHGAHGSMDQSGGTKTLTPGGSGANTDPTDAANNQNPSNR